MPDFKTDWLNYFENVPVGNKQQYGGGTLIKTGPGVATFTLPSGFTQTFRVSDNPTVIAGQNPGILGEWVDTYGEKYLNENVWTKGTNPGTYADSPAITLARMGMSYVPTNDYVNEEASPLFAPVSSYKKPDPASVDYGGGAIMDYDTPITAISDTVKNWLNSIVTWPKDENGNSTKPVNPVLPPVEVTSWYQNPLYIGIAAIAAGGLLFIFLKKRR